MKLTAPPPPPPEPPQTGDPPGAEAPPGPDAPPPAELPPLPPPPPRPTAKPATWPQWYDGADTLLVALAVAVAFLVASFAARNSDLWVHLATGKMLTTGDYTPGTDPFSYTAADRPWVNHAWLFDLACYVLYRGDGFALVLAKGLAVAAAVGLLVGIRRSPHALWPWAAVAVVAVVAAAPRLTLNPLVGSFVFLSVTMFLVFRLPSPPGSWRLAISIGVTFWLWANFDAWFFVGPLALLLLLVGEVIRTKALNADGPSTPPDDPLGPLPDIATLAKALGVGVLACMLNPHHVRVWELPYELIGGPGTDDPRLRQLLTTTLTRDYWFTEGYGWNVNGLAFLILLVGGLYATVLSGVVARLANKPWDVEPLPLPHTLLWLGFAALASATIFAVPFLAVVSVPLLASRLNAFASRVELGAEDDTGSRMALALATVGRVASVAGLVALGVCAWPGWLHPTSGNPAASRRVAWEVTPDAGLVRAAEEIGRWRAAGHLAADERGFVASLDLANYLAWYAPGEKVFANTRYNHHRGEWAAFARCRQGLGVIRPPEGVGFKDAAAVLDGTKASYLAVSVSGVDTPLGRLLAKAATHQLWANEARCAAWYLDGRTAVCGWRAGPAATGPSFDRLRVDPVALAFGPHAERLKAGTIEPVPPPRTWESDFTRPARPAPAAADEAMAWLEYKEVMMASRYTPAFQAAALLCRVNPTGFSPPIAGNLYQAVMEGQFMQGNSRSLNPADGSFRAVPILALKAARKAIADNPDHPDGYNALAQAMSDQELPMNDAERVVGMACALRQCLTRLPPPDEIEPGSSGVEGWKVARQLAVLYAGQLQRSGAAPGTPLDLAHEAMALAGKYADREIRVRPEDKDMRENREQVLKGLKAQTDRLAAATEQAVVKYEQVWRLRPGAKTRFDAALGLNLYKEAIRVVKELPEADAKREFGDNLRRVYLQVISLEITVGWVEEAAGDLEGVRETIEKEAAAQPPPPGARETLALMWVLQGQLLTYTGNYEAAGLKLEATEGEVLSLPAPPPPPPGLRPGWPAVAVVPSLGGTFELWRYYQQVDMYLRMRQQVLNQSNQQAGFYFRRGFLALLEGDVDGARVRFRESRRPAIPAWDVPELVHVMTPAYLSMIEAAAKR